MRSLAGMRVQDAQRALPGIRRYADAMAEAIGAALTLMGEPRPDRPTARGETALVLFAAEHGFVGGYNERLIAEAARVMGPRDALFVLGSNGAARAVEAGRRIAWREAMATRVTGASETVLRLESELYRRIVRGEIARVELLFARQRRGSAPALERRLVLPLDLPSFAARQMRQPPLHNLAPEPLLEKLIEGYVFARLLEAAVEAIASENAARFDCMDGAHDNAAKKLAALEQEAREARQSEITIELLELVTGAEAIGGAE